jgi:phosphatidylethanolamine/phosphatidyl-N-methylethanolamine N-methyltransferase
VEKDAKMSCSLTMARRRDREPNRFQTHLRRKRAERRHAVTSRLSENWHFVVEAARDPRAIGAVAPSGAALAHALTAPIHGMQDRSLSVLEVGAGTGSITRILLPMLTGGSTVDVVEPKPAFVQRLRRLGRAAAGQIDRPEVRVHECAIEQMQGCGRYDAIVSGLPFTNFQPDDVQAIMDRYVAMLKPQGALTYFAYRGTNVARRLVSSQAEARRHNAVEDLLRTYHRRHHASSVTVWTNVPPAQVWTLRPWGVPVFAPH